MSTEPRFSEDEAALAALNSELRHAVEEARSSLCQALNDAHVLLDLLRAERGTVTAGLKRSDSST